MRRRRRHANHFSANVPCSQFAPHLCVALAALQSVRKVCRASFLPHISKCQRGSLSAPHSQMAILPSRWLHPAAPPCPCASSAVVLTCSSCQSFLTTSILPVAWKSADMPLSRSEWDIKGHGMGRRCQRGCSGFNCSN